MKKHLSTIIIVVILLAGIAIFLYPSFSDWWNSTHATRVVATYEAEVDDLSEAEKKRLWDEAVEWNEYLAQTHAILGELSESERATYNTLLQFGTTGAISYVEIPTIHCLLPIYRGTDESVLQTAIGHLEGSSLPVGGSSTHCVISGHRGLPSMQLFSRLDELDVGDTFMLHTLDTTLTYEVDQILIVEPDELGSLAIQQGRDLCTLVTCTPYGVNSHRLLVRGHRVSNERGADVSADALQIDEIIVASVLAVFFLILLLIALAYRAHRRRLQRERRLSVGLPAELRDIDINDRLRM